MNKKNDYYFFIYMIKDVNWRVFERELPYNKRVYLYVDKIKLLFFQYRTLDDKFSYDENYMKDLDYLVFHDTRYYSKSLRISDFITQPSVIVIPSYLIKKNETFTIQCYNKTIMPHVKQFLIDEIAK
jgi:hypothetical protein